MATVSKWTPFGVALDITATVNSVTRTSATSYKVVFDVSWETYYNGAKTNYGMDANSGGTNITISSFGTSRSGGSAQLTVIYTISGNGAATKNVTVTFKNYNTDKNQSAAKGIGLTVSVPAWTSYKVTYSANGGSGAPSAQTKWKGQALTLSTVKPTRTGYSFQGWATSSSATTAAYTSGGSYTSDAAVTLYAVWKANTYTVSYNANGGSGAPSSQTKTYGKSLTLSSTKPTRTNYTFKGWATSASATTVAFASGASYTANAAVTLYAVWESSYVKPRITSFSVTRCTSNGTADASGTYARVKFNWACDRTVTDILIYWAAPDVAGSNGTKDLNPTGTSGTVNTIIGDGLLNAEHTYNIRALVTDSGGQTEKQKSLNGDAFLIDCLPENAGLAFGKPAEKSGYADFKFKTYHRENVELENNKSVAGMHPDGNPYIALMPVTESGNLALGYGLYNVSKGASNLYGNIINFYTKDGVYFNSNDIYFNNNQVIYGKKPDGTFCEAVNPQNTNGNLVLGYGNYKGASGSTNIYGYDILFGVSSIADPGSYRPYRRRGDSLTVTLKTSGYCTNGKADVIFHIPFTAPIVGTPTVSISSGNGFILRQGDKYTHGSNGASSPNVYAVPTSYSAVLSMWHGITVTAKFSDVTNAINNNPIGIHWHGTITFS
jgi:uncharacterized repeat protein (TIGR02543 family)